MGKERVVRARLQNDFSVQNLLESRHGTVSVREFGRHALYFSRGEVVGVWTRAETLENTLVYLEVE